MTYALSWAPFAFLVTVALWRMLSSLPDRLGESRTPEIIGKSTGLILATAGLGALYFVGGGAVVVSGGGPSARGTPAEPAGPPSTPTVSAIVVNDAADSLALSTTAFVGDESDTHDSTAFQVDTTGGDFSSPQYHDVVLGAVTVDTAAAVDSGAVVDVRARHKGAEGGWSSWDTLTGVTMERLTFYACSDWRSATGGTLEAVNDTSNSADCLHAGDWDGATNSDLEVVNATSEGLTDWPTTNALKISASDRGDGGVAANNRNWLANDSLWTPLIQVGSSVYLRYYYQVDSTFATSDSATASALPDTHGTAFPNGGGSSQEHSSVPTYYNDGFSYHEVLRGDVGGAAFGKWGVHTGNWNTVPDRFHYQADYTYRIEKQFRVLTDTTYEMHLRIYDVPGDSLLHDDDDFHPINDVTTSLVDSMSFGFLMARDSLGGFQIGTSAFAGAEMTQVTLPSGLEYYGAVAICSDWCGAYSGRD